MTFLLRKYLEPKLFFAEITPFAGTILFLNYPLQELSFFTTVPYQQSFASLIVWIL